MKTRLFKWETGRQMSGYDKMLLLGSKYIIIFDVYILRFNTGSEIKPHTDTVERGQHYRLNIVLKKAKSGGEFYCEKPIFQTSRIKLFRPDICEHSVSKIQSGKRYVLSVGWVKGV